MLLMDIVLSTRWPKALLGSSDVALLLQHNKL